MANSINTNISAYYAQSNIAKASSAASTSVSRLSSGNFITKASDDVARLSIGTSFSTTVKTLRQALTNASQGISLLQVADGALGQITEILQRQKTLAVQASSGNLSNTDRSFLNQEFQALSEQIDFISSTASFNGVKLLDGGLSNAVSVSDTATQATAGQLTISFVDNIADDETVIINGVTLTAETGTVGDKEFAVGATVQETVENLAARLNLLSSDNSLINTTFTTSDKLALSEATYEAVGNTLVIKSRTGGALSDSFRVSSVGTASTNNEGVLSGQYAGSSFNLFTAASSTTITTTSYVLSDTGGSASADPFDVGESLKLTVAGVEHTLITFTSGGGSGTGGAYTLQDVVNGINANSATTGVTAATVFNGTSYNIRISYNSQNGIAILDGGNSYVSTTFKLTGDNIDYSGTHLATTGDDLTKSVLAADGYETLFQADLANVTNQATELTIASSPTVTNPLQDGDIIRATVNGTQYVLHVLADGDGLDNIVSSINSTTATTGIYALVDEANGSALNVRLYVSDPSGAALTGISLDTGANANAVAAEGTGTLTASTGLTRVSSYGLDGGADDGLGLGDVALTSSSTTGDEILTAIGQVKAESRFLFTRNLTSSDITSSAKITFGSKEFFFTSTALASSAPNEILIGSTLQETLDNAVRTLNRYFQDGHALGSEAYVFNQVNITRDGDALVIQGKKLDNVLSITGAAVSTTTGLGTSIVSVTSSNLSNASSTFGVKVNGISNADFYGTISGFNATYTGTTDQVDLSITVGDYTYRADNADLTVASNTTIRFLSDTNADGTNGGYFDVQLRANEISTFTSQAAADVIASRLDAAFSSIEFLQKRNVSSYEAGGSFSVAGTVTGSLLGTTITAQLSDFEDLTLSDVSVATATGSATDAVVTLTINGVEYSTSADIGTTLRSNQTYRLTSADDANQFLEFTVGDVAIDLGNADKAAAFEDALRDAFGAVSGSSSLSFQIGTSSDESLGVSIESATTDALFEGESLSIATIEDATVASDTIDAALSSITSIRASVGALQSRFNFASANIQISVQNQDASRSELLDTDIAAESTSYATAQVQLQAGISVLAQANQQLQALLKLLG